MDAFHALQPCLLELMREMLDKSFLQHEMRLYADRQWQLIIVEVLLLSPHFSTCIEEEVVAFMAVLANAQNAKVSGWTSANAFKKVDLASHGDSLSSSITNSSPCNPPFP